jgi:hypothetical protein
MLWQPLHSATPPEWNASALPPARNNRNAVESIARPILDLMNPTSEKNGEVPGKIRREGTRQIEDTSTTLPGQDVSKEFCSVVYRRNSLQVWIFTTTGAVIPAATPYR